MKRFYSNDMDTHKENSQYQRVGSGGRELKPRPGQRLTSDIVNFPVFYVYLYYGQVFINLRVIAMFLPIICIYVSNVYHPNPFEFFLFQTFKRLTAFHLYHKRPCNERPVC